MNFATALQFDSISLPAWTVTVIRHTRRAAVQASIVIKAFAKTIAPVISTTAKDLSHYYWLCVQGAGQWAMHRAGITHNPVQAAVRAAYAELVSDEATVTYRRIGHIIRETAMDALVVGLCGVAAISVGVDVVQKGYRTAAKLYRAVYGRFNPSEPQPELLPSVNMAIASEELAVALDHFATVAEANVQAKADADAEVQYSLEAMKQPVEFEPVPDFWIEPLPLIHTPPVVGPVWNPAPGRDMHLEVAQLMALQYVPFTLAPAPEPVAQPTSEPQSEQKPARAPRSRTKAQPQDKANVKPKLGATAKGQRKSAKTRAEAK